MVVMSAEALNPRQFHEMTRGEFESQPNLWWHGTSTGIIGHQGESFHVGSRHAAVDALSARVAGHGGLGSQAEREERIKQAPGAELYGGHITAPMMNTPRIHPSRGPGSDWHIREGIPRGEMADWPRRSSTEPMSDARANAVQSGLKTKGQKMRRGIFYVNAAEGAHRPKDEREHISAIIPNRAGFKTHEDYLVQARAQGKKIPKRAMKGYTQIPGQGKLF
jgi:hypothetical protein